MSVDYAFYPRSYIGKYIEDINIFNGRIQGYRWSQANIFCNIVGLPKIPYYYCIAEDGMEFDVPDRDECWMLYFKLSSKYSLYSRNRIIAISNRTHKMRKSRLREYRAYTHWEKWGLNKLESITVEDILNNKKIKRKDIYGNIDDMNEIKQDIKKFLWYYKNHYCMFSLV